MTNFASWKSRKRHSSLTKEQLRDFFVANGDKAFRGNQVYEWLWGKAVHSFDDMTNVSKKLETCFRNELHYQSYKGRYPMQRSEDGTVKNAVRLHDDLIVKAF